jgi:hypothetical protein
VEEVVGIGDRYKELQERSFHGPKFQTLCEVSRGSGNVFRDMQQKVKLCEDVPKKTLTKM